MKINQKSVIIKLKDYNNNKQKKKIINKRESDVERETLNKKFPGIREWRYERFNKFFGICKDEKSFMKIQKGRGNRIRYNVYFSKVKAIVMD